MSETKYTQITREEAQKAFISRVFSYLAAALAITGVAAYWFGTSPELLQYLINFETGSNTILGWVVMLAPLGFVFMLGKMIRDFTVGQMTAALVAFSALMGMSMSYIFLAYTASTIYSTFFITAGTFGIMAFVGYTTKTDLSKFGKILIMALIGLILASVVNWFMGSSMLDFGISCIGVLIFTGLTAYDMQKIKNNAAEMLATGPEMATKLAMYSAVDLYLDFINLFLFLLRLFGGRRD